jgi:hypothetical protein
MWDSLTNADKKTYHMGNVMLSLWKRCDGKTSVDTLVTQLSEEHAKSICTEASVKEMLGLLENNKLINYPVEDSAA